MASALRSSKAVTKSNDLRGSWREAHPPDGLTPKPIADRERRFFGAAVFVGTEKAPTEAGAILRSSPAYRLCQCFGVKCRHGLYATVPLGHIPHGECEKRFGLRRVDYIDEIVLPLGVIDSFQGNAEFTKLGFGALNSLAVLRDPIGTQRT